MATAPVADETQKYIELTAKGAADAALRARQSGAQEDPAAKSGGGGGGGEKSGGRGKDKAGKPGKTKLQEVMDAAGAGYDPSKVHFDPSAALYAPGVAAGTAGRPLVMSNTHQLVMQGLIDRGVRPEVAAGAVGSLMGESGNGLNPRAYNPDDNGSPSGGIAQWHKERLTGLYNFAGTSDIKQIPTEVQVKYLLHELDTGADGGKTLEGLRAGRTVADGVSIWTKSYERPENADQKVAERMHRGESMWTSYSTNGAAPAGEAAAGQLRSNISVNGHNYEFGSGGAGRGAIPEGHYPITPNEMGAWGQAHGAIGINHNAIWDKNLGDYRRGIEFHSATNDKLITQGCISVAGDKWPQFKQDVMQVLQDHGKAYLHVDKNGASVTPYPDAKTVYTDDKGQAKAPVVNNNGAVTHTTAIPSNASVRMDDKAMPANARTYMDAADVRGNPREGTTVNIKDLESYDMANRKNSVSTQDWKDPGAAENARNRPKTVDAPYPPRRPEAIPEIDRGPAPGAASGPNQKTNAPLPPHRPDVMPRGDTYNATPQDVRPGVYPDRIPRTPYTGHSPDGRQWTDPGHFENRARNEQGMVGQVRNGKDVPHNVTLGMPAQEGMASQFEQQALRQGDAPAYDVGPQTKPGRDPAIPTIDKGPAAGPASMPNPKVNAPLPPHRPTDLQPAPGSERPADKLDPRIAQQSKGLWSGEGALPDDEWLKQHPHAVWDKDGFFPYGKAGDSWRAPMTAPGQDGWHAPMAAPSDVPKRPADALNSTAKQPDPVPLPPRRPADLQPAAQPAASTQTTQPAAAPPQQAAPASDGPFDWLGSIFGNPDNLNDQYQQPANASAEGGASSGGDFDLGGGFDNIGSALQSFFGGFKRGGLVQSFARGGLVGKPNTGRPDRVASAQPGVAIPTGNRNTDPGGGYSARRSVSAGYARGGAVRAYALGGEVEDDTQTMEASSPSLETGVTLGDPTSDRVTAAPPESLHELTPEQAGTGRPEDVDPSKYYAGGAGEEDYVIGPNSAEAKQQAAIDKYAAQKAIAQQYHQPKNLKELITQTMMGAMTGIENDYGITAAGQRLQARQGQAVPTNAAGGDTDIFDEIGRALGLAVDNEAATPEQSAALSQAVDPHQKLNDGMRNTVRLWAGIEHLTAAGDYKGAEELTRSLVLHQTMLAARYGGEAYDAFSKGDTQTGIDALKKAHDQIPDGTSVKAKPTGDGGAIVTQTTADGKSLGTHRLDESQMMGLALGLKDPRGAWAAIAHAVNKDKIELPHSDAYTRWAGSQGGSGPAIPEPDASDPAALKSHREALRIAGPQPMMDAGYGDMSAGEQKTVKQKYDEDYKAWRDRYMQAAGMNKQQDSQEFRQASQGRQFEHSDQSQGKQFEHSEKLQKDRQTYQTDERLSRQEWVERTKREAEERAAGYGLSGGKYDKAVDTALTEMIPDIEPGTPRHSELTGISGQLLANNPGMPPTEAVRAAVAIAWGKASQVEGGMKLPDGRVVKYAAPAPAAPPATKPTAPSAGTW